MNSFYCNKCNEDVQLIDGKCPKCGTNWREVVSDSVSDESLPYDYRINQIIETKSDNLGCYQKNNDIEDTYNFFIEYALIGKNICFALAVIIFVISIIGIEMTYGISLFLIIPAIIIALYGIILEKNFKWKSYMLQTNYKMSKK